jgi:hypothetical protein
MSIEITALRQQGGYGITCALEKELHHRRQRESPDQQQQQQEETANEQQQQQTKPQTDFAKTVPQALEQSIKECGGDDANLVIRFRISPITESQQKKNMFEMLNIVVATLVEKNQKLESFTLDLERCGVDDDLLEELFKFSEKIATSYKITHLFLAGNLITAKGLKTLLLVPDKNPPITTETGKNLVHLGVTANPLGGKGLEILSEFLEINPITNKLKILHATRIAWVSASSSPLQQFANQHQPRPSKPPGPIMVYEAERFANATKNATELKTVFFKQNTIQKSVDEEIPWPKKVILEDSS